MEHGCVYIWQDFGLARMSGSHGLVQETTHGPMHKSPENVLVELGPIMGWQFTNLQNQVAAHLAAQSEKAASFLECELLEEFQTARTQYQMTL